LTASHIRSLYNRNYFQAQDTFLGDGRGYVGGYRDYIADQAYYLQTFRRRLKWVNKYSCQGQRLLDVGCAAGFFMAVAQGEGWQVQGVDPSSFVANYARSQLGMHVYQGTLQDANFPSESWDVVTLWDVLEHMPDPRQELVEIHRVLKRRGILALETQNIDSLLPKILGNSWGHYGHHLHLFHFTPKTITRILAETGFRVVKITSKDAGKVSSIRFLVDKLHAINETLYSVLNRLLSAFPSLAHRSIYINPGDEMIVIAQKNEKRHKPC
jgi:2-polyprenyl-3-methyl-5-hydroxy-6-metoxy-1,4-benzoquinol methylase